MFRGQKIQRLISTVVLVAFTANATFFPLQAAAQAKGAIAAAQPDSSRSLTGSSGLPGAAASVAGPDERMSEVLGAVYDELKVAVPETALSGQARRSNEKLLAAKGAAAAGALRGATSGELALHAQAIRARAAELRTLYPQIEQAFAATEQHLRQAKLPETILNRQRTAVVQYLARKTEFERLIGNLEAAADGSAGQQAALSDLGSFMAKYPHAKPHTFTDPSRLPFTAPVGKVRAPYASRADYQASLFRPAYEKVMLASLTMNGIQLKQVVLPATPTPDDTAATGEVQITDPIKALALQLNNNPVQIYNWVKSNIEFIPSYGSIQGSSTTLLNRRGNAFDTASLLIALYRAAGIPARYVYGTVEVPAAAVMNWVGGVSTPDAAQSLLSQGGIPNVALVAGGVVKAFRLEHVWVQAYVDYAPSRGAINMRATTWVQLDPSFKQRTPVQGMNIQANVPTNGQDVLAQIQQGATVDDAQGFVQGLNMSNMQAVLNNYQPQVQAYVSAQKTNATVGDMLGTQTLNTENRAFLLGTLPYQTVAVGSVFQSMPENLKWRFKTNIYPADGYADSSTPYIELDQATVDLAGKKISLSFVPASQADQDLIASYVPKPHADGTPVALSEMPGTLPGYLINMNAELRVNGQVTAHSVSSFLLGSAVRQSAQYFNPALQAWQGGDDNDVTVGEYNAIGIDLQGESAQVGHALQDKIGSTTAKMQRYQLNPSDPAPVSEITGDDLVGDLVYAGILGYFIQTDTQEKITALANGNIVNYRLPSYGRFFTEAQPHYLFGIVRGVSFPAAVMDVDFLVTQNESSSGNADAKLHYMREIGAAGSAMEHLVPERLFRNPQLTPTDPQQPQGFSAVKALAAAVAQGQKIYTLDRNNLALHDTILQGLQISSDAKLEIANALAAGRSVTVHEKAVRIGSWSGSGYLILDPDTGAGAYKIEGGMNGGGVEIAKFLASAVGMLLFFAGTAAVSPFLLGLFAMVALFVALYSALLKATEILDEGGNCAAAVAEMYFGIASTLAILSTLFHISSKSVEGLVYKLIGTMYGADLFKSVAGSRACH
jgi:transglutaminase-like putative cysteine protease